MEQQAQYDIGNVDLSKVDCDETPQTVDQYLRQVAAGRLRIPEIAYVNRPTEKPSHELKPIPKRDDRLAPTKEWQQKKLQVYRENRERLAHIRGLMPSLDITWPSIYSPNEWIAMLLKKPRSVVPEEIKRLFPEHDGTPPTLDMLFSMSNADVENLIQTLVHYLCYKPTKKVEPTIEVNDEKGESDEMLDVEVTPEAENLENEHEEQDEEEEPHLRLDRAMQHWIYALLLILKKNYLHDVLASLRDLANFCRKARASLFDADLDKEERNEMAQVYSLFIVIVAQYFEQKDLSD